MTILENNTDSILDHLTNLSNSDLISLWNTYCQKHNYSDDEIFDNDEEFFNIHYGNDVLKAVRDVEGTSYSYNDDYVQITIWGLRSTDDPFNYIDKMALADDILKDAGIYDIELEE